MWKAKAKGTYTGHEQTENTTETETHCSGDDCFERT